MDKNRNEIISILNYSLDILKSRNENNEIEDELEEVILQLEKEWKDEFEEDEI